MICCINQLYRPSLKWHEDGVGDCTICKASKDNENCKWYYPIEWTAIEVEERGDE